MLGKPRLNQRKGTARLAVTVPGPDAVRLLIRATRKQFRRLSETGKGTVPPRATYTPVGGSPGAQSTEIRLKKL